MRYLMFFMVMMLANVAHAMNCEKVPTCEELGYSTEDEPNCADGGYMYCPFNHEYKKCVNMDCAKMGFSESDKSSWCPEVVNCKGNPKYTACNCLKPRCNIGDVFYADGSCGDVKNYTASKIAVGVVYYTNCAGGGKVINLKDFGRASLNTAFNPAKPYETACKVFLWSGTETDISDLENWNCSSHDYRVAAQSENHENTFWSGGKSYTKIITEYVSNNLLYAAPAARAFYPHADLKNNSLVGEGNWYLPTLGELMDLYGYNYQKLVNCEGIDGATGTTKEKVNATLASLKEKGVQAEVLSGFYRSSSESNDHLSWHLTMSTGSRDDNHKTYEEYVRASLEF